MALERQPSRDFVLLDAAGTQRVSNHQKTDDFVLVHESPISKRRELRASKELAPEDREALTIIVAAASDAPAPEVEPDEAGVVVAPSPPVRKASYKNGRRVSAQGMPGWESPGSPAHKQKAADPTSPTGVADDFFAGMLSGERLNTLIG